MRSATSTKRSVFVRGLPGTINAELLAPSRRAVLSVRTMMLARNVCLCEVYGAICVAVVELSLKVAHLRPTDADAARRSNASGGVA